MEETKICAKCGIELPLSEFSKDKSSKDGLQSWCKNCKKQHAKQWYTDNIEHKKQYVKQYYANNADARKQYMKQYHADYYATIEGYARNIRKNNLQADRMYGRIGADEDPLAPLEYYVWGIQQRDFYDGKQYHWSEMGFDRIDNSKPHTIDNVVPCSTKNNKRRGRMSFEEFRDYIQNKRL